jgi:hypothetical protein
MIALKMEAVSTFETPVNFWQTTWPNISEENYVCGVCLLVSV